MTTEPSAESLACYCTEAMGCCWDECPACWQFSSCVSGFDDDDDDDDPAPIDGSVAP